MKRPDGTPLTAEMLCNTVVGQAFENMERDGKLAAAVVMHGPDPRVVGVVANDEGEKVWATVALAQIAVRTRAEAIVFVGEGTVKGTFDGDTADIVFDAAMFCYWSLDRERWGYARIVEVGEARKRTFGEVRWLEEPNRGSIMQAFRAALEGLKR